jgi:hypothetical protein
MSFLNGIMKGILQVNNISILNYQPYPEGRLQTSAMPSFAVKLGLNISVEMHHDRKGMPIKSRSGTDDNIPRHLYYRNICMYLSTYEARSQVLKISCRYAQMLNLGDVHMLSSFLARF